MVDVGDFVVNTGLLVGTRVGDLDGGVGLLVGIRVGEDVASLVGCRVVGFFVG